MLGFAPQPSLQISTSLQFCSLVGWVECNETQRLGLQLADGRRPYTCSGMNPLMENSYYNARLPNRYVLLPILASSTQPMGVWFFTYF
jgi:hypothetical protein